MHIMSYIVLLCIHCMYGMLYYTVDDERGYLFFELLQYTNIIHSAFPIIKLLKKFKLYYLTL